MSYDLAYSAWEESDIDAACAVLKSGWMTMGKRVREFEERFAKKLNRQHAVLVNSGSSANLIATASLFYCKENPLNPGDEVIVPAVAWSTTYFPLHQYGLKLKIVDVELDTLNVSIDQVKKAIGPQTRAIVGVSILGNPAPLDQIKELCAENELIFLEDNCESLGAKLNDRYTGTFGDISTNSFFFSHQLSTIEGGMLTTDCEELYHLALSLRAHGWTRDIPKESIVLRDCLPAAPGSYHFVLPGYNVRPTEITAALGLKQLEKLDEMVEKRRLNAQHFVERFTDHPKFLILKEQGQSSWFCFPLILRPGVHLCRADVFEVLEKNGIAFRTITGGNILQHDVIRHLNYEVSGTPMNAPIIHDQGFFVGNGPVDLRAKIDQLFDCVKIL